jgi:hypothetical protein
VPAEKLIQVRILDENGVQHGEKVMLTDDQANELLEYLPEGWTTEEV